ncbi:MAG: hypothetical protein ACSHYA_03380 [Opitutaceae bacterium]
MNDLESANEKFMGAIQQGEMRNASILTSLIYDLKVLDENKVIEYIVEEHELGLVDLSFIELQSLRPMGVDLDLCWATSTIPFDYVDGTYLVATCYYLSAPVIKHWEESLDGKIIWYSTSCTSMTRALEQIAVIHQSEDTDADEEDEDE